MRPGKKMRADPWWVSARGVTRAALPEQRLCGERN
jgi:hypothetical protein